MAAPSSRTVIVRNLKMTNSFALNPVRRCWNMIGPPLSSLTAIATIKESGDKNNIAVTEPTTSRVRLTALSKAVNGAPWIVTGSDNPSVDKPRCPSRVLTGQDLARGGHDNKRINNPSQDFDFLAGDFELAEIPR